VGAVKKALLRIGGIENGFRHAPVQVDLVDPAIDVATVIKDGAADLVAHPRQVHWEAKLLIQDEHGLSDNRETSDGIARAGLIEGKATKRRAAAGEEAFGKRNDAGQRFHCWRWERKRNGIAVGREHADADRASKAEAPLDGVIGRILVGE